MEAIKLEAKKRSVVGKQVKQLRSKGKIPAVVYGHDVASRSLEIEAAPFEKTFTKAGWSSLLDLAIDGAAPVKVLIQDIARHPLTDAVTHVDLREVKMTEKLTAEVLFRFLGEAPAVKEIGGIFVRAMDKVKVRCLPQYLVHEIDVDISKLKNFEDHVLIKDLAIPEGLELLAKPDEIVAGISKPISEEELKALDTAVVADVSTVKVEGEEKRAADAAKKAEEAKGAEGEKPAAAAGKSGK
ncbi:50S ribosomal protein L25 [Candidatus Uhrbacteria bacterium]|nr:50S ribosomal protein L25 [Candidatus Uhrbacteria bacterium]